MTKIIRHVSELPDWFDIRAYEDWEGRVPYEAAQAVDDRLWLKRLIHSGFIVFEEDVPEWPEGTLQAMLDHLASTSAHGRL